MPMARDRARRTAPGERKAGSRRSEMARMLGAISPDESYEMELVSGVEPGEDALRRSRTTTSTRTTS